MGKESWRWKKESFDFGWIEDPSNINPNQFWSCGGDRRCNYIDDREMIGGRSIDFRSMFDSLFDRGSIYFSIDFRYLWECCRSIGGGLEGWRRIGGRLEKDRRRIGEGLEEDGSIDFR